MAARPGPGKGPWQPPVPGVNGYMPAEGYSRYGPWPEWKYEGVGPQHTPMLWGIQSDHEWYEQCGACDGHTEGKVPNKETARIKYGFAWNKKEQLYMCCYCNINYSGKEAAQLGHHCFSTFFLLIGQALVGPPYPLR